MNGASFTKTVGPSGGGHTYSWSGVFAGYKYFDGLGNSVTGGTSGTQYRIRSTKPTTIFYGDYSESGCCSAAFMPVVDAGATLPPVAEIAPVLPVCPQHGGTILSASPSVRYDLFMLFCP